MITFFHVTNRDNSKKFENYIGQAFVERFAIFKMCQRLELQVTGLMYILPYVTFFTNLGNFEACLGVEPNMCIGHLRAIHLKAVMFFLPWNV